MSKACVMKRLRENAMARVEEVASEMTAVFHRLRCILKHWRRRTAKVIAPREGVVSSAAATVGVTPAWQVRQTASTPLTNKDKLRKRTWDLLLHSPSPSAKQRPKPQVVVVQQQRGTKAQRKGGNISLRHWLLWANRQLSRRRLRSRLFERYRLERGWSRWFRAMRGRLTSKFCSIMSARAAGALRGAWSRLAELTQRRAHVALGALHWARRRQLRMLLVFAASRFCSVRLTMACRTEAAARTRHEHRGKVLTIRVWAARTRLLRRLRLNALAGDQRRLLRTHARRWLFYARNFMAAHVAKKRRADAHRRRLFSLRAVAQLVLPLAMRYQHMRALASFKSGPWRRLRLKAALKAWLSAHRHDAACRAYAGLYARFYAHHRLVAALVALRKATRMGARVRAEARWAVAKSGKDLKRWGLRYLVHRTLQVYAQRGRVRTGRRYQRALTCFAALKGWRRRAQQVQQLKERQQAAYLPQFRLRSLVSVLSSLNGVVQRARQQRLGDALHVAGQLARITTRLQGAAVRGRGRKQIEAAAKRWRLRRGMRRFIQSLDHIQALRDQWASMKQSAARANALRLQRRVFRGIVSHHEQEHAGLLRSSRKAARQYRRRLLLRVRVGAGARKSRREHVLGMQGHSVKISIRRGLAALRAHIAFSHSCVAFGQATAQAAIWLSAQRALQGWAHQCLHARHNLSTLLGQAHGSRLLLSRALWAWRDDFVERRRLFKLRHKRATAGPLLAAMKQWDSPSRRLATSHQRLALTRAAEHRARIYQRRGMGALIAHLMISWAERKVARALRARALAAWVDAVSRRTRAKQLLLRMAQRRRRVELEVGVGQWREGAALQGKLLLHLARTSALQCGAALQILQALPAKHSCSQAVLNKAQHFHLAYHLLGRFLRISRQAILWRRWTEEAQTIGQAHDKMRRRRRVLLTMLLLVRHRVADGMFLRKSFAHLSVRVVAYMNRRRFQRALLQVALRTQQRAALALLRTRTVSVKQSRRKAHLAKRPHLVLLKSLRLLTELKAQADDWHCSSSQSRTLRRLQASADDRAESRRTLAACVVYLAQRRLFQAVRLLKRACRRRRRTQRRLARGCVVLTQQALKRGLIKLSLNVLLNWADRAKERIAARRAESMAVSRGFSSILEKRKRLTLKELQ